MARSIWKGHITFGLVTIPVGLYTAARYKRVAFSNLHSVCQTKLKQPKYCPDCERFVERDEIVKGYEIEKGVYVLVEPEELAKVAPQSSRAMEMLDFVKMEEVDPMYMQTSYFVVPEAAGKKAYALLLRTMEEMKLVGIAKVTMHEREHVSILRPQNGGLMLHTMYYTDEISKVAEYGKNHVKVAAAELKMAKQLVESLQTEFKPEKYRDEYEERVKELIRAKEKGERVIATPKPQLRPVKDLMSALKKSLAEAEAGKLKKPAAKVTPIRRRKHAA